MQSCCVPLAWHFSLTSFKTLQCFLGQHHYLWTVVQKLRGDSNRSRHHIHHDLGSSVKESEEWSHIRRRAYQVRISWHTRTTNRPVTEKWSESSFFVFHFRVLFRHWLVLDYFCSSRGLLIMRSLSTFSLFASRSRVSWGGLPFVCVVSCLRVRKSQTLPPHSPDLMCSLVKVL